MRTQQRARDGRMSLREHLVEARNRLFLAGLGILVGTVLGWFLYEPVFELLQQPILDVAAEKGRTVALNFAGVASAMSDVPPASSISSVRAERDLAMSSPLLLSPRSVPRRP